MIGTLRLVATAVGLAVLPLGVGGQIIQESIDYDVIAKIRDEGLNRSQIPALAHQLTDVIGPRLTGSPGIKRANEWTAATFRQWGLSNVQIEPWGEFGRGWDHVSYSARITAPWSQPLIAYPAAWSGSTKGTVQGPVIAIEAATPEELVGKYRGRLKDAFILTAEHRVLGPEFEQRDRRLDADALLEPPPQAQGQGGGRGGRGGQAGGPPTPQQLALQQARAMQDTLNAMAAREGAAAMLRQSTWRYGIIP
jgi:hypothetical protein